MVLEERKHRKEMEKEDRDRDDSETESTTGSVEEEIINEGKKWWQIWKDSK